MLFGGCMCLCECADFKLLNSGMGSHGVQWMKRAVARRRNADDALLLSASVDSSSVERQVTFFCDDGGGTIAIAASFFMMLGVGRSGLLRALPTPLRR